jgi:hypothetical protein
MPDFTPSAVPRLKRECQRLREQRDALLAVAEDVVLFGPALIARQYEPGSQTVRELVEQARSAVKLTEPTR